MENIKINENAHTKIMREMSAFLDICKNEKIDCNCTCLLEYNKDEENEYKRYKFTYQCDSNPIANEMVKVLTNTILTNATIETYKTD